MTFFLLSYLAGVLTILSPCILPVLPFVLARAGQPFRRSGLPMLAGMALAFAAVASLAAVAGGWAVELNRHGRSVALVAMALFGLALIFPALSAKATAPLVALGDRLARAAGTGTRPGFAASVLLGIATGLLWAPCAGPVLGLILAGAALGGPSLATSAYLLAYAAGAATSLAVALLFGGRLFAGLKRTLKAGEGLRAVLGAGVLAGALSIALGLDTGLLARLSSAGTTALEQRLVELFRPAAGGGVAPASTAQAATPAAPLFGAEHWLNTPALSADSVKGKVVLVNFWTYSCINCLRSLPHVRAWAEKYKDRGLVVVGVHTPEFAFEKDAANVAKAATALGITYPVVIDNDFKVWRSFDNQAWPALYFIGADGKLRHHRFGEGEYEQSERLIQKLLSEAQGAPVDEPLMPVVAMGAQAEADLDNLRSGETYIGHAQARGFASPGGIREDAPSVYQPAATPTLNHWSLAGRWTVGAEFATAEEANGRIIHRFHARDLHLVLAPPKAGPPVRFRIRIDGQAPGAGHGADVDAEGWGTVREDRLYQLVRQAGAVMDRTFEIEFLDPGVRAYAFTFG